ncbi:MAG: hypothetical protein AAF447_00560, partial [Myxococcota bacterium]
MMVIILREAPLVLGQQVGALLAAVMVAGPAGGLAEDDPRQRVAATAVRELSIAPGRDVGKAIEA